MLAPALDGRETEVPADFGGGHFAFVFVITTQKAADRWPLQNAPAWFPGARVENQHVDRVRVQGIESGNAEIRGFGREHRMVNIAERGIAQRLGEGPSGVNGLAGISFLEKLSGDAVELDEIDQREIVLVGKWEGRIDKESSE